ncbi:MAG: hypothetical protein WC748_05020 [Legionellales bacterium]|jgi:hypothetical protein
MPQPPVIIDQALLKSLEARVNDILEMHHQNKADIQGLLLLTAESVLLLNFAINRLLEANSSVGIGCTLLTLTALMLACWA